MRPWGGIALATILVAIAITAPSAGAASTRADYVVQVEQVCRATQKPLFKAFNQFIHGLTRKTQHGGLSGISGPLLRLARQSAGIYGYETAQIAAVAPAPGDEMSSSAWLQARGQALAIFDQGLPLVKHRKVKQGNRLFTQGYNASLYAVQPVVSYSLNYCALGIGDTEGF